MIITKSLSGQIDKDDPPIDDATLRQWITMYEEEKCLLHGTDPSSITVNVIDTKFMAHKIWEAVS